MSDTRTLRVNETTWRRFRAAAILDGLSMEELLSKLLDLNETAKK